MHVQTDVTAYQLVGFYAERLDVNESMQLFASHFILQFHHRTNHSVIYWHASWHEDDKGADHLLIREQQTPEPLSFVVEPLISASPLITTSQFLLHDAVVQRISLYGYNEDGVISAVLIELSTGVVCIETGPLIEVQYTKHKQVPRGQYVRTLFQ